MLEPVYTHERNFGCRLTEMTYRGLKSLVMENELLRVTILVDKGTDVFEFLHKPTDTDFMWRSPLGVRATRNFVPSNPRADGPFLDYYFGGWQECFPVGGYPTTVADGEFGLHGETPLMPWNMQVLLDTPECISVKFDVRTYRAPLRIEKVVTLHRWQANLQFHEIVTNEGDVPFEILWGHHPAFGAPFLDSSCVVDLPGAKVRVVEAESTTRLESGEDYTWPFVKGRDGSTIDLSRIPGPETKSHDLAFLFDLEAGWYGLTNQARKVGFGMYWPTEIFNSIWFWQVYRGSAGHPWYGRTYNIALEPWTAPYHHFAEAQSHSATRMMAPGEVLDIRFGAVAYAGLERVTGISTSGDVSGS